jgi:hypothetical protein
VVVALLVEKALSVICFCSSSRFEPFFFIFNIFELAFYIPPKQDQAFNQGGTFLFDGNDTVFAHYDESTGAHSDIDRVIALARERL